MLFSSFIQKLSIFIFVLNICFALKECNRTGFSGPKCEFLDCGENGKLNTNGLECLCEDGFDGKYCLDCAIKPKTEENRQYICCALTTDHIEDLENKQDAVWWLLAPKMKDLPRFLSGIYSQENCLVPGSTFFQGENIDYILDCNCKVYTSNDLEKRNKLTPSENQKLIQNFKRSEISASTDLELFWKKEIEKRDRKYGSSMYSPIVMADILVKGNNLISQKNLNSQMVNSSLHQTTIQKSSVDGVKLLIITNFIGVAIGILTIALMIYLRCKRK